MSRLADRVALITGGARGQGEAEARLFIQEGARVVIADVRHDQGRDLAASLGPSCLYVELDVSSERDWAHATEAAVQAFGGLDVLINNAGVLHLAPLEHTSLEVYRRVIEVNQIGVFLGLRAGAQWMRDGGSIINVSSIDGLSPQAGTVAYAASKFAVRGMTKVAALEFAERGIRVNTIHPGLIDTPMTAAPGGAEILARVISAVPMRRGGRASEVARLAAFLASDESSYCTGAEFVVDGGWTAGRGSALSLPSTRAGES